MSQGVRTLAARLGSARSFGLYALLIVAPFVASAYTAVRHTLVGVLPLLAAPKAFSLLRTFRDGELARLPMKTAKFQFVFGMLLVASVLLPAPSLLNLLGR